MFSSGPNYTKLKTHLRLALNRLKLLEKKKSELTQKARKEIADYLTTNKVERARIRVEHIIREDYLVEAMEIVEMYCDLLLARFGLVTQMTELDDGIAEAVFSLVWVAPRMQTDIQELKVISDIFISKYGKEFGEQARNATGDHKVSEKLMHKLAIQAPPKLLVEKYIVEIAKNYNIEYEPDPQVMKDDQKPIGLDGFLIDLSDRNNLSGPHPPQVGFIGYPQPPPLPVMPEPPSNKPFNYPPFGGGGGGGAGAVAPPPFPYNIPPMPQNQPPQQPYQQKPGAPSERKDLNINTNFINEETNEISPPSYPNSDSPDDNLQPESLPPRYSSVVHNDNLQKSSKPKPQPRSKLPPGNLDQHQASAPAAEFPNLPSVPNDLPGSVGEKKDDDEIDFDDLSRRFEELKKRK
ncbi:IST1 homolog isoform X3 [Hermetia illucens]|uniref:IST1 homolog isoform X3 n=1 Tax=Hermetia illucens TaxID=343691 RepID=UPI0018CC5441|nr:IST1 homolog isoform X3 [Hermetia illucens]